MSLLQPTIESVINGSVTIAVASPTAVAVEFDQLLILKASAANGPYTQIAGVSPVTLDGSGSYTVVDVNGEPQDYFRAQFYNSSTLTAGTASDLAQETGVFSEYTQPESTATYPPEIALSTQDREIVESIRVTIGDLGSVERDYYDSSSTQSVHACAEHISADQCTWEMKEYRGWPRSVVLNGETKVSVADPVVIGYRFLTFSGAVPCITGTLDVFYNTFRLSDREVLLAYDRAGNLLVSCGLTTAQITTEMLIIQAAILLLDGEMAQTQENAIAIVDGDTSYDNTRGLRSRAESLTGLKRKINDLIECALHNVSYSLEGVRID